MVLIVASVAVVIIANRATDHPRPYQSLHVTVVATATTTRAFIRETLAEAAAIWRPAGLAIVWDGVTSDRSASPASDLTVTVDEGATSSPDGKATLGWITFAGPDVPESEIHLSRGNALELMTRTASVHDNASAWQELLLSRALGRALAHELGHYLLKSRAHTPHGLMRAIRPSSEFFSSSRLGFEITEEQRASLADRLPCA